MIRPAAFPVRVLAASLAVFALAGCVKKQPTEVNPSYVPEGTFSQNARLIAYPNLPSTVLVMADLPPLNQVGPPDTLIRTEELIRGVPGAMRMMLFDGTQASAFELLRREASGGYFALNDFLIPPTRKWLDGAREVYVTEDDKPGGYTPSTYMMRGVVGGEITTESPLTNAAIVSSPTVQPIHYTGISAPADSNFTISWDEVPGAAGYWLQVYQFFQATRDDQTYSGLPAPAYVDKERDYFLAYVPAPAGSYTLGTTPASVEIFTRRTMLRGQVYFVRVAAVSADGDLIAYTYGDYLVVPDPDNPQYSLFPLGAEAINVRSGAPQTTTRPATAAGLSGVDLWMGDVPIVRASSVRR